LKKFKIQFKNMVCAECFNQLYVDEIYRGLREQYEPNTGAKGYTSILLSKCKCGAKYKIVFDCHEYKDIITACVNHIVKTKSGENFWMR
jgi:hypothetical protein